MLKNNQSCVGAVNAFQQRAGRCELTDALALQSLLIRQRAGLTGEGNTSHPMQLLCGLSNLLPP